MLKNSKELLAILIVVFCSVFQSFTQPTLKPNPHPRLLLPDRELNNLIKICTENETIGKIHSDILKESNRYLELPTLNRKLTGKRLLSVSREALKRILYLSYSFRITGNERYAKRAIDEIIAVSNFSDWNPSHFLDVAEMTMAVSIGYDWLYDIIPEDIKHLITTAIREKALEISYDNRYNTFLQTSSNWNAVCNAGLICGAISFFEDLPELTENVIQRSIKSNQKFLDVFSPDGGFPEGYNYWEYGVSFQTLLLDALEQAFDQNIDSPNYTDFLKTPEWMLHMNAPSGKCFNFSDCPDNCSLQVGSWWFAYKKNNPSLVYNDWQLLSKDDERFTGLRLLPIIPIFASRVNLDDIREPNTKIWTGKGKTPVFLYRSGWSSIADTYLGVKGGSSSTPHGHMDAGSFVYEADGIRWAVDLGSQNYYSIESKGIDLWNYKQDGERWKVMRMRNDYHNTITVDSTTHNVNVVAEIIDVIDTKDKIGATVDLTETLSNLKEAKRTVFLNENNELNVIDHIETKNKEAQILWIMQTPCVPEIIDKNKIILKTACKSRTLVVDTNLDIKMIIWNNNPIHEYDEPVKNVYRVGYISTVPPNYSSEIKVSLQKSKK